MNQLTLPIVEQIPEVAPDERPSIIRKRERDQTFFYIEKQFQGESHFLWKNVKGHPIWIKTSEAKHRKPRRFKLMTTAQDYAKRYKNAVVRLWNPAKTSA